MALADTVRALQKEKSDIHHGTNEDGDMSSGNGNSDDSDSDHNVDSPMYFKAREVHVLYHPSLYFAY